MNLPKTYLKEIIAFIKKAKPNKDQLSKKKTLLAKKYKVGYIPTDIQLLLSLPLAQVKHLKKYLQAKPTRSISGVAIIAMMTKPTRCPHGVCTFCPGGPGSPFGNVPQSYTGKEPSTRRSIRNDYDAYLITINRLEQYVVAGHVPDKVEVIVQGGTFPFHSQKYQKDYIKNVFKAMNDFSTLFFTQGTFNFKKFKDFFELPGDINNKDRQARIKKKLLKIKNKPTRLEKEQKKNEKADIRCVGLTIETKPDYGKLKHGNELLKLGATRIELGIQTVYDDILKATHRGHTIKDSIKSIQQLKDLGYKLNFHMMPGLPGSNKKKDLFSLKEIFKNEDYRPDMLKIYPCMVMKGTALYAQWKLGKFKPITTKEAASLIATFKKDVPEYCRIMRVQRDIPTFMTEEGVDKTNLRQYVDKELKKRKIKCHCIRCREVGINQLKNKRIKLKKPIIKTKHYLASGGNEFFISAEDTKNDLLYGYCRLRFPSQFLRSEITEDTALIREIHVVGQATALGKAGKVQHKGIGKALMAKAEEIAKQYYKNKIVVISGVGARRYFSKLGYKRDGPYMSKKI